MRALSLIGLVFAAFLIFLGVRSRGSAGGVLGNALVVGGAIIAVFVAAVWLTLFIKEKGKKDSDPDS